MQFSPFLYYCLKSVLGILELEVNLLFALCSIVNYQNKFLLLSRLLCESFYLHLSDLECKGD